jgi:hypothetical protein
MNDLLKRDLPAEGSLVKPPDPDPKEVWPYQEIWPDRKYWTIGEGIRNRPDPASRRFKKTKKAKPIQAGGCIVVNGLNETQEHSPLHSISSPITANRNLPAPEANEHVEGDGDQLPGYTPLSSTLGDANRFLQHRRTQLFNWTTHDEEEEEEEHLLRITPEMVRLAAVLPGRDWGIDDDSPTERRGLVGRPQYP